MKRLNRIVDVLLDSHSLGIGQGKHLEDAVAGRDEVAAERAEFAVAEQLVVFADSGAATRTAIGHRRLLRRSNNFLDKDVGYAPSLLLPCALALRGCFVEGVAHALVLPRLDHPQARRRAVLRQDLGHAAAVEALE